MHGHDRFRQKSNESKDQSDMRIERIRHKADQEKKLLGRDMGNGENRTGIRSNGQRKDLD